jgi:hypothetical protein
MGEFAGRQVVVSDLPIIFMAVRGWRFLMYALKLGADLSSPPLTSTGIISMLRQGGAVGLFASETNRHRAF